MADPLDMNREANASQEPQMRRRVRRTALRLALLAFAIYCAFVAVSVLHGHR